MERAKIALVLGVFVFSHLFEVFGNQKQAGALISRLLLRDFTIEQCKLPAIFWSHDRGAL